MNRPSVALWLVVWLAYLAFGVYLAAGLHVYFGDSLSRVQAAQSVLFSRDPHLAAIGFIFTPLTALVQLPLTALSVWWPQLTTDALSAAIMSSSFMAGAVVQVSGIARDRALPKTMTVIVTLVFALNPMIVLYAANGMSEAPYLFFLAWAVRRLIRWVDTDDVHELIVAGIALGLAYLTRYDGAVAAFVAGCFVAFVTYRRSDKAAGRRLRTQRALLDVVLVASPSLLAFIVWAATSWLITGQAFAQFTSQYGNSAIIDQSGGTGSATGFDALRFSITELLILAPLYLVLFVLVAWVRIRRHRLYPLAVPVLIIGAVVAFQVYSYMRGTTFGFLRFYMTVIVLAAVTALLATPARRIEPYRRLGPRAALPHADSRAGRGWRYGVVGVVAVLAFAVGLPVTAAGMTSPKYAPQEFAYRSVIAPQPDSTEKRYLDEERVLRSFSTERALAEYLDSLHLPDGSVLTDTVYGFAVVVQSRHPKQFVIPSDQDFDRVLNEPARFGVRFLLAVPRAGRGSSDALNIRYPTLYENGNQISTLALEARNQGTNMPTWRVYEVNPSQGDGPR
ncbi:ArnT family glycosyltransferase [Gordonia aichiensis]|uniref:Glycosyltransferase RgtA/B/C/D-like domain-containing protein n=1 Tax=Gordonia aichiensis NBRC 108223 TaxID=1220583 RepID=L7KG86_9ACTN|nr:glycosyltransferase family 39 protein [Gordonia aichiensis]GAC46952.1 hypothetical protein GOACH_02_00280 [Gordonia aichiensis NBRC 108223]